jgi:hypothetical protein
MKKRTLALGLSALLYTSTPSPVTSKLPESNFVSESVEDISAVEKYGSLSDFIRDQPYEAITDQVYENWYQIRSWVLLSEGPCGEKNSHIFANLNGD